MRYTEFVNNQKPRNRIKELGGRALANAELLSVALWIRESEAAESLAQLYNQYGSLAAIPREKIVEIKGLGNQVADAVNAISEIVRREATNVAEPKPSINSPEDIAQLVMYEMSALDREELWVMLLDSRNQVLKIDRLYKGTLDSCTVKVGEIFRSAIVEGAASIIVLHNHPSGDPEPSVDDIKLTRAIREAGRLVDIELLDHMVIAGGRFVSFKARGLGF